MREAQELGDEHVPLRMGKQHAPDLSSVLFPRPSLWEFFVRAPFECSPKGRADRASVAENSLGGRGTPAAAACTLSLSAFVCQTFPWAAGWLAGLWRVAPLSSGAALCICVLHTALWLSRPLLAECALASLLPSLAQVEKWEAQREAGTYPGPVPGEKKGGH